MNDVSVFTEHAPVDKLQFLRTRMRTRQKGSAVLISSEGGMARFWDIFGKPEPLGIPACNITCSSINMK